MLGVTAYKMNGVRLIHIQCTRISMLSSTLLSNSMDLIGKRQTLSIVGIATRKKLTLCRKTGRVVKAEIMQTMNYPMLR